MVLYKDNAFYFFVHREKKPLGRLVLKVFSKMNISPDSITPFPGGMRKLKSKFSKVNDEKPGLCVVINIKEGSDVKI